MFGGRPFNLANENLSSNRSKHKLEHENRRKNPKINFLNFSYPFVINFFCNIFIRTLQTAHFVVPFHIRVRAKIETEIFLTAGASANYKWEIEIRCL